MGTIKKKLHAPSMQEMIHHRRAGARRQFGGGQHTTLTSPTRAQGQPHSAASACVYPALRAPAAAIVLRSILPAWIGEPTFRAPASSASFASACVLPGSSSLLAAAIFLSSLQLRHLASSYLTQPYYPPSWPLIQHPQDTGSSSLCSASACVQLRSWSLHAAAVNIVDFDLHFHWHHFTQDKLISALMAASACVSHTSVAAAVMFVEMLRLVLHRPGFVQHFKKFSLGNELCLPAYSNSLAAAVSCTGLILDVCIFLGFISIRPLLFSSLACLMHA